MRKGPSGQSGITAWRTVPGGLGLLFVCLVWAARLTSLGAAANRAALVTLSIVGTSDLHGAALPRNGLGGLPLLAGYVNNLRAARSADGGAVLLLDSGDTFQGNTESNLSEGALVVDAYNAMGYTAEAVGTTISISGPSTRRRRDSCRATLEARSRRAPLTRAIRSSPRI